MENKIRVGITQGDASGVGPEVIVKALENPDILELFTPVVFGKSDVILNTIEMLAPEEFPYKVITTIEDIDDSLINIFEVPGELQQVSAGSPSKETGRAAVAALEEASRAIEAGAIDLLVTAPIDKNMVQSEEFAFPGHTEFLEDRFAVGGGRALMILADGDLRVSLVTTHKAMKDIAPAITKENVVEAVKAFNRALKMDFGVERPKIGVLSLNPHCGDGGVLGTEEQEQIIPAIEECRKEGILAFGPISADGLFGSGSYRNFDGILAMYHDQGLAPFKALSGGGGVNFTAGLNIVRTSPAHGTGFDIAGKGLASERSMREAIYAAIDIARRRDNYLSASENPLPVREQVKKEPRRRDDRPAVEPNAEDLAPVDDKEE